MKFNAIIKRTDNIILEWRLGAGVRVCELINLRKLFKKKMKFSIPIQIESIQNYQFLSEFPIYFERKDFLEAT